MPISDPDADIVALLRSRDGRERGAALLVRRHGVRIARLIGAMVPPADRDDVVQGAYIAAFTRIGSHEGRGDFAGWVSVIAVNLARDHLRRLRRLRVTAVDAIDLERLSMADAGERSSDIDREAVIACLRRQFERFAADHPEHGKALFLFHFLKWDQKAIAAATGRTHEAARKFVSDSRKRLRPYVAPCLEDPDPDPDPSRDADFDRWLERLKGRIEVPPSTATEREAAMLGSLFEQMAGAPALSPKSLADLEAGVLRGVRAAETRRTMVRRLALAASIVATAGAGGAYWMTRRTRPDHEIVEASADFETRFVVRGARTRVVADDAPESAARELAASARAASVPYRLRREKADWIVDLFVAAPKAPLTSVLARFGVEIAADAPALSVRFVDRRRPQ